MNSNQLLPIHRLFTRGLLMLGGSRGGSWFSRCYHLLNCYQLLDSGPQFWLGKMRVAIESLLNLYIIFKITGRARHLQPSRNESARALHRMLYGSGSLGFDMKLNFALALRLVSSTTKERLAILNTLRNKCSHNSVLKVPVRHGKRPAQKKPPLLLYEGRDLHTVAALKDFTSEYGGIYVRLYMKIP